VLNRNLSIRDMIRPSLVLSTSDGHRPFSFTVYRKSNSVAMRGTDGLGADNINGISDRVGLGHVAVAKRPYGIIYTGIYRWLYICCSLVMLESVIAWQF
jgi:hypothetical protein